MRITLSTIVKRHLYTHLGQPKNQVLIYFSWYLYFVKCGKQNELKHKSKMQPKCKQNEAQTNYKTKPKLIQKLDSSPGGGVEIKLRGSKSRTKIKLRGAKSSPQQQQADSKPRTQAQRLNTGSKTQQKPCFVYMLLVF